MCLACHNPGQITKEETSYEVEKSTFVKLKRSIMNLYKEGKNHDKNNKRYKGLFSTIQ